ncbi:MAG TPA: GWxTD domain-containing protein [Thermoanaerobaculia bacterium]|nr:GWxTD domain-containing protein [Thermoanaerobaculia bacterium]
MKVVTTLLVAALTLPAFASVDPAEALAQARANISNKQYREAAAALDPAIEAAATIADPATRAQALSALHFYSAVAYAGIKDDVAATKHLREYLAANPNAHAIDASKYDKHFVELFNELAQAGQNASGFDSYYPGFGTFTPREKKYVNPGAFGPNPALLILGTKAEQQQFRALVAEADREKFITEFWARRDPTPGTPQNEFQETFNRRAEFADQAFSTNDGLGSMTDRGKVFILLGEPAYVRRRPVMQEDKLVIIDNPVINGTIEQWVYTRDQMPMKLAKPRVMYRFVTHEGIGDHVLQRQEDVFAMQALVAAATPANPKSR